MIVPLMGAIGCAAHKQASWGALNNYLHRVRLDSGLCHTLLAQVPSACAVTLCASVRGTLAGDAPETGA